ncbi:MAG: hypothetical protein KKI03_00900, partial [Gammaproteobacteria bacterium]|nr:hypothetical protein [Gammaproteobacteria bacterium]
MPDTVEVRISAAKGTHQLAQHPTPATFEVSPASVPNRSQNQSGDALCEGKGGEREAGAGTRSKAYRPADSPT